MDPIDNLVTEDTPAAIRKQATLKEMARRSQDRILVYNPTDEDYTVRFDGIGFIVPNRNKDAGHGFGKAVVFRYVAENYRTQIIDLILTIGMDTAVRLENERRAALGMQPMTKFVGGEELQFSQSLRTDNREARAKLIPTIWLGLAERYGEETRVESMSGKPKDDRPLDDILTDELATRGVSIPQAQLADSKPLEDLTNKNVFALRKMAKEKGIEVEKTAKKNELIDLISK